MKTDNEIQPNPTSTLHPALRRGLKALFVLLAMAICSALILKLFVWHRSQTPLSYSRPSPDAAFDLEAFRRGELQFPGDRWRAAPPQALGWSSQGLEATHGFARSLDISSMMIIHRGVPVAIWGDVETRENSQSIRKSLLSSLFGFLVADGRLDLDSTLAELEIDDNPPLTSAERSARVRQLLLSRSGIYHSAIYEAGLWKRNKPARSSAEPGSQWYYNNWDFNALGTIFEQSAGLGLDRAFDSWIAEPIGMEDYRPEDVIFVDRGAATERILGNESDHPAYVFFISARDLARFGLLYLADGRWRSEEVVSAGWIEESTRAAFQPTGWYDLEYGFMWWRYPQDDTWSAEMLVARGGRGHRLLILPEHDLVIVYRIPTGGVSLGAQLFRRFVWRPSISHQAHTRLLDMILGAMPKEAMTDPDLSDRPPESAPSAS